MFAKRIELSSFIATLKSSKNVCDIIWMPNSYGLWQFCNGILVEFDVKDPGILLNGFSLMCKHMVLDTIYLVNVSFIPSF